MHTLQRGGCSEEDELGEPQCQTGQWHGFSAMHRTYKAALDDKLLNLSQEDIIKEAQTMKSYHHPNVLPLHTSFIVGQDLYMITPFCEGGSVLHIMKYNAKEVSTRYIIIHK
jgi:serine/threonine protein kinase